MPGEHRAHTPIVSEEQRRLFYYWQGHPEARPKSISRKLVLGHLREVAGKKLPKSVKKGDYMDTRLGFYIPITKVDADKRMVYGIATNTQLDKQGDVVDWNATKEALEDYSKWRNIREMHKPSAVGIAPLLEARDDKEELYVGAKIVDDQAWNKCKEGVYKGFSLGGETLDRRVEFSKGSNKTINRITKYVLNEISLVDRPANPSCIFQTLKRDTSVETITVAEDPLKGESARVMEKAITLAKKILSKEDLESLPDDQFGLIKVVSDGDKLIKHRLYPMPDRVHAINMVRKMVKDELAEDEKGRIHENALLVLGKKHSETECPYCIQNKIGGVTVGKELNKQVTVTEEPTKKTVKITDDKKAEDIKGKPTVAVGAEEGKAQVAEKAPEAQAATPAEDQKPHIVVDEEDEDVGQVGAAGVGAATLATISDKLDQVISLLSGEEEEQQDTGYEEEDGDEDPGKVKVKVAEEDEEDEDEDEDEAAQTDAKPAKEEFDWKEKAKEDEEECVKAAKAKTLKKVKRVGLLSKLKGVIEPLSKEVRSLNERLEKVEKAPLPRKDAKGTEIQKVERIYSEPTIKKDETPYSAELQKDISKAEDLRKSGRALSKEEDTFCQRVAERMIAEKFSK